MSHNIFFITFRYEGTGRSLSLKLIEQLRSQSVVTAGKPTKTSETGQESSNTTSGRMLVELSLNESIRYLVLLVGQNVLAVYEQSTSNMKCY